MLEEIARVLGWMCVLSLLTIFLGAVLFMGAGLFCSAVSKLFNLSPKNPIRMMNDRMNQRR